MDKKFLTFLAELAASGAMLYYQSHPNDSNIAATLWLIIWKAARTVATAAGRLGMRAEVRYFQTVKL